MDSIFLVIALGAGVAGFVQGLSGFAFGMVAMSFWAWTLNPQLAAVLTVFGSLLGQIIAAITVRRGFRMGRLLPFLLGGLVGVPVGVAILPALNVQLFKTVLGCLLVLWCPAMYFSKNLPKVSIGGKVADGFVGGLGGLMCGIGGFSGVIPTLWCTLRGFDKDEQRAIIQNFNFAALAVTMAIYLSKGFVTPQMLPMLGVVAIAMVIPAVLGARLYVGISEANFRKIVQGLLTLSGVALLSSSLPALLSSP